MEFQHKSVLLGETIDALKIKSDGVYMPMQFVQDYRIKGILLGLTKMQMQLRQQGSGWQNFRIRSQLFGITTAMPDKRWQNWEFRK